MLTHNTSTVIVFQSIEYRNFTMIKGNRGMDERKIKRIIKDIENGNDMLMYYPIQVRVINDKLEIFDGQHRFFICKRLKRPVHYILINEKKNLTDIAKVNSNVEKWKAQDFINCFIQNGNNHYKRLQVFLDTYKINVGTSLCLLSNGSPGGDGSHHEILDKFEHGLFEIKAWEQAVEFADECLLFNVSPYSTDRSFLIAIYRIKKAGLIDIKVLAAAVKKYPDMLEKQVNYKSYTLNLEAIVNKNKQKRIIIS